MKVLHSKLRIVLIMLSMIAIISPFWIFSSSDESNSVKHSSNLEKQPQQNTVLTSDLKSGEFTLSENTLDKKGAENKEGFGEQAEAEDQNSSKEKAHQVTQSAANFAATNENKLSNDSHAAQHNTAQSNTKQPSVPYANAKQNNTASSPANQSSTKQDSKRLNTEPDAASQEKQQSLTANNLKQAHKEQSKSSVTASSKSTKHSESSALDSQGQSLSGEIDLNNLPQPELQEETLSTAYQSENEADSNKIAEKDGALLKENNSDSNLAQAKEKNQAPKEANTFDKEQTANSGLTLQQRVDAIMQKQTALEQAKYAQAQQERQQYVDNVVESIKAQSKIYLPEYLSSRAVIVYFGVDLKQPKDSKNTISVDGVSGPTKLAMPRDENQSTQGKRSTPKFKYGSGVNYIANMLHEESGAAVYNIVTVESYPNTKAELYELASKQQTANLRPELMDDQPLDLNDYDTIYLCYSIWWNDLPMPIYSFLDKFDLSGKTLIPICINTTQNMYKTLDSLNRAEPNASIRHSWLINPNDLANENFRKTMQNWLTTLSAELN